jgi:hypothetical protein
MISRYFSKVDLHISRDPASTRSDTYNQANNRYGNITPKKNINQQRKNILRVTMRS